METRSRQPTHAKWGRSYLLRITIRLSTSRYYTKAKAEVRTRQFDRGSQCENVMPWRQGNHGAFVILASQHIRQLHALSPGFQRESQGLHFKILARECLFFQPITSVDQLRPWIAMEKKWSLRLSATILIRCTIA
jgi:hypothetical protein